MAEQRFQGFQGTFELVHLASRIAFGVAVVRDDVLLDERQNQLVDAHVARRLIEQPAATGLPPLKDSGVFDLAGLAIKLAEQYILLTARDDIHERDAGLPGTVTAIGWSAGAGSGHAANLHFRERSRKL